MRLRAHPAIYEINTWVWLSELGTSLAGVPGEEWDRVAGRGIDAVWLMGVWERSPVGAEVARVELKLPPGYISDDFVGSPYCVRSYTVDERLGGDDALAAARAALAARGVGLILDFVPNHTAIDHPWVVDHPEYFVQTTGDDPDSREVGGATIALARDPYFPAWRDVLQLNTFLPEVREAAVHSLRQVAERADGVRCDMAMLMLTDVFLRTWGARAGTPPEREYWPQVIEAVKPEYPDFTFLAEVYWDLEWTLMSQGFDYCYDKRLYDRLVDGDAELVRQHLVADLAFQSRLVRFIENHDEPRASAVFSAPALRGAAVVAATLPGAALFHDGQFTGRRVRVNVALGRWPDEPEDADLVAFYRRLVATAHDMKSGEWRLCEVRGWPDNQSCGSIVAWSWRADELMYIVAVNLAPTASQGRLALDGVPSAGRVVLTDLLGGGVFERDCAQIADEGLYVGLEGLAFHVLRGRLPTVSPRTGDDVRPAG